MNHRDDFLIAIFCICFSHAIYDIFSEGRFSMAAVILSGVFMACGVLMFFKGIVPYFKENDYSMKRLCSYLREAYRAESNSEEKKE